MTYRGHVKNGLIVLDDAVELPEGTEVAVELMDSARTSLAAQFKNVIGSVPDLPPDMAHQHDHYIHGTPKQ